MAEPLFIDEEIYKKIRKQLKKELDHKRYTHTRGVAAICVALAMAHGFDMNKAYLAGLLHDNAKCIPTEDKLKLCSKYKISLSESEKKNPELIHAKLGAYRLKDTFDISDQDIFSAVCCHTTGKINMSVLDKILYIADYIEPARKPLKGMDAVREMSFRDLDQAMFMILESTLEYLKSNKDDIDSATMETYQYFNQLINGKGNEQE